MGMAIELMLDPESASRVAYLREKLREEGVLGIVPDNEFRPHLTIGYFEDSPPERVREVLERLAQDNTPCTVTLSNIGIFTSPERNTVFFGVTPTQELLDLHRRVFEPFCQLSEAIGEYCLPDRLVFHVSVADRVSPEQMADVMKVLVRENAMTPIVGQAVSLLVEPTGHLPVVVEFSREIGRDQQITAAVRPGAQSRRCVRHRSLRRGN